MEKVCFVDCHCHLFNIADIPLYATIEATAEGITTLEAFGAAILASRGAASMLYDHKELLLFFERSIDENIELMVQQVQETLEEMGDGDGLKILTPLVMDFDEITPRFSNQLRGRDDLTDRSLIPGMSGVNAELTDRDKNVYGIMVPNRLVKRQIMRLREAILHRDAWLKKMGFRILPFLGYDPRKLTRAGGLNDFKALWQAVGGITAPSKRRDPSALNNGDVIGVKLYPPIGFNPYGETLEQRECFLEFYAWLCDNRIPITVHCQGRKGGSFSTRKNLVDARTDPKNWEKVLKTTEYPLSKKKVDLKNLRINFAHFAGEKDMDDMIDWKHWPKGIDKKTWSWTIVRLLHEYQNTYADLAAFDFTPWQIKDLVPYSGAVNALVGLLDKDAGGDLFKKADSVVCEKMLWGSDVPMIISGNWMRKELCEENESHYKYLYNTFESAVSRCKAYDTPQKRKVLLKKIICSNTCRFLFP